MRASLFVWASAVALLAAAPASAETLPEAMVTTLNTNPALASQREQLEAVRQALPLAWSEALPQVSSNSAITNTQRSEKIPAIFAREQPEYWISSINTSLLLFGSGRVFYSTRQARAQIANAVASYKAAAQDLMLDVVRAYGDVMLARAVKDAQERDLDNLREQFNYVSANVQHGFLTQTDLAQARARVEQARASLAQADAQLVAANEAYNRIVGHSPAYLEPVNDLNGLPPSLEAALEMAGRENPRILAAIGNVNAAEAGANLAGVQNGPRVTVETTDSIFHATEQASAHQQSEESVSLRVSVPLFTGGAYSARARQQRHLHRAASFDLTNVQREIEEQVTSAWANQHSAQASVAASLARVEAAEIAQRGMVREQQAGLRTVIDVLNQEQELLSARVDLARAQRDELVADRQLASSVGELIVLSIDALPPNATGSHARPSRNHDGYWGPGPANAPVRAPQPHAADEPIPSSDVASASPASADSPIATATASPDTAPITVAGAPSTPAAPTPATTQTQETSFWGPAPAAPPAIAATEAEQPRKRSIWQRLTGRNRRDASPAGTSNTVAPPEGTPSAAVVETPAPAAQATPTQSTETTPEGAPLVEPVTTDTPLLDAHIAPALHLEQASAPDYWGRASNARNRDSMSSGGEP